MSKKNTNAVPKLLPQNKDEAAKFLAEISGINRAIERAEADLNDSIDALRKAYERDVQPLREKFADRVEGLEFFCNANRDELTDGGKTKTVDLGTGIVSWRKSPPKVVLRGTEKIVAFLRASRSIVHSQFLRVKYEIDKEAMLKSPKDAAKIKGVTIDEGTETFYFEAAEAPLKAEAQS